MESKLGSRSKIAFCPLAPVEPIARDDRMTIATVKIKKWPRSSQRSKKSTNTRNSWGIRVSILADIRIASSPNGGEDLFNGMAPGGKRETSKSEARHH